MALKLGNRKRWVWLSPPWLLLLLSVELRKLSFEIRIRSNFCCLLLFYPGEMPANLGCVTTELSFLEDLRRLLPLLPLLRPQPPPQGLAEEIK